MELAHFNLHVMMMLTAAVVALLVCPSRAIDCFDENCIRGAILQVNIDAQACVGYTYCWRYAWVTLQSPDAIYITSPLPALVPWASLNIACGDPIRSSCLLDGQNKTKLFSTPQGNHTGPFAQINAKGVSFRGFKGGVFSNVWATISVASCDFYGNTGGVIIGNSTQGGFPRVGILSSTFTNNPDGVVIFGSTTLGSALYPAGQALHIQNCSFITKSRSDGASFVIIKGSGISTFVNNTFQFANNNANFSQTRTNTEGGAVRLDYTNATFTECQFKSNGVANSDGGAVYLNSTTVTFTKCLFQSNAATRGGAVAGQSFIPSPFDVTFNECTFEGNRASFTNSSDLYFSVNGLKGGGVRLTFFKTAMTLLSIV